MQRQPQGPTLAQQIGAQQQAAIVAQSQPQAPTMPMLGMQSSGPAQPPAAPVPGNTSFQPGGSNMAFSGPPQMLGAQGPPPPVLAPAGTYTDPNQQPQAPSFPWGADPSGLGGAQAGLGGYMGF